jgi:hypothetical protein
MMTVFKKKPYAAWIFTIIITFLIILVGYSKSTIEFEKTKYKQIIHRDVFSYSWIERNIDVDTMNLPLGAKPVKGAFIIDNRSRYRDTIRVSFIYKDTLTTWDMYNLFVKYKPYYKSMRDSEIPILDEDRYIQRLQRRTEQRVDPRFRRAYKVPGINIINGVPLIISMILGTLIIAVAYFLTNNS